ncbi:DUF262 domain-containing protein [Aureibacter tunicatorum]|uniref:Uncharacterized protein with ParB-like and HNH nuclease domain n=1 Tax=Aureibacter tunicatorum TaxID=866807 RepID=A0AAE3XN20_9BACT|nr:DUF262 domain-containing HNH endonuclease family protein [Aureibacter tunicatorum]MDR6239482.1 uncharacterized protein with ParB-like and HNH nuclease domain [Aureibacter tunicatorum]BDD04596.1 hypothetical protein AUTU_20790 [Aureibacter tunicatorum]
MDYKLDTGKKYIREIFSSDKFYNIPEYQRPYVWGEEQVITLLDDLQHAMDNSADKEYFLGCMIWNTKKKTTDDTSYECQDILDGQQRFITLYLLHGVMRDLGEEKQLKDTVTKRLCQEGNKFDGIPSRNRIEFEIRDDEQFLANYLLKENGTLELDKLKQIATNHQQSSSVRNMAMAIVTMHKWWEEKRTEEGDNFQKSIASFFTYLSSKVLALFLATPDNLDDAYNLFTVLNSRGLQLQVSDILRAQNLREIQDDKTRKEYAEKWSELENTINAPFNHFDDFLWNLVFIKMKYRSDDNQSLTKAFNHLYNRKKDKLVKGIDTIDFVSKYIEHYKAITNGEFIDKDTSCLFSNLNYILTSVFGSQYMSPMMLYRERFGEYRIVEYFLKLDNLLSITWLMGKRQSQTRIFTILRKIDECFEKIENENISLKEACDQFFDSTIIDYDYQDENSTTQQINLEDFFDVLDKEKWGGFAGNRINKTRYLLLKLDLIRGNISTRMQFNKSQSSVEHIMPRKKTNEYWKNISDEDHALWLHRLGNIILLDRRKNASLSNSDYHKKVSKYKEGIEARANTNNVFMNYQEWNIKNIKDNHQDVLRLLKEYYQGNDIATLLRIKKGEYSLFV